MRTPPAPYDDTDWAAAICVAEHAPADEVPGLLDMLGLTPAQLSEPVAQAAKRTQERHEPRPGAYAGIGGNTPRRATRYGGDH